MGAIVILIDNYLKTIIYYKIIRMAIGAIIGIITYYCLTLIFKVDEIKILGRRKQIGNLEE